MDNVFSKKLRDLREKHFPGESLRRLGKKWEGEGLGEYFYTQLSKMETGALLPTEEFVKKIAKALGLDQAETIDLLSALMVQRFHEKEFFPKNSLSEQTAEAVGQLFRKVKKKKT